MMKGNSKKLFGLLLVTVMALSLLPLSALAAPLPIPADGVITVPGLYNITTGPNGYFVTIAVDGVALTGTHDNIGVRINAGITLTLYGINIGKEPNSPAIEAMGMNCTLVLIGNNILRPNDYGGHAGVQVPVTSSLTILGPGSLTATGSRYGAAGIGGAVGQSCGEITIRNATIIATGGSVADPSGGGGAGIGGGGGSGSDRGNGNNITIINSAVTARGGNGGVGGGGGAGIGGGGGSEAIPDRHGGNGNNITITNSAVAAIGGAGGAGNGPGTPGNGGGAGIGGGGGAGFGSHGGTAAIISVTPKQLAAGSGGGAGGPGGDADSTTGGNGALCGNGGSIGSSSSDSNGSPLITDLTFGPVVSESNRPYATDPGYPLPPSVTGPTAETVFAVGGNASFSVLPSTGYLFQWQVSTNSGIDWTDLTEGGVYSGTTAATLTLTGIPAAYNGYQYRCEASNSVGTTTSGPFTLTAYTGSAVVSDISINGTVGVPLQGRQIATITITNDAVAGNGLVNRDASGWVMGLPPGLGVTADAAPGSREITLTFNGTPTAASDAPINIRIPGSVLTTGNIDLPVAVNSSAVFSVTADNRSATVSDIIIEGSVGEALRGGQTAVITLLNETVNPFSENATDWFANLPSGLTVTATALTGNTIQLNFAGTPLQASNQPFELTIPGNVLNGGIPLAVNSSANVQFNIVEASQPPSPLPETGDSFPLWQLFLLMSVSLVGAAWFGYRRRVRKT